MANLDEKYAERLNLLANPPAAAPIGTVTNEIKATSPLSIHYNRQSHTSPERNTTPTDPMPASPRLRVVGQ